MELSDALSNYKQITLEAIDYLQGGGSELIKNYFDRRAIILHELEEKKYPQKELKELCEAFEIVQLDEKLRSTLKERMQETKKRLKRINQTKKVMKNYNKNSKDPLMLSIKI